MGDDKSLLNIDLGGISKPAVVFLEKISDALVGGLKPWQTVRVAKAEAEACEIQARSEIKITDMQRRAARRFFEEEAKKQLNIEAITQKALPLIEDKSAPQNVENDWLTNFFDKSRIVSDGDMQELWARVLAGEANSPGGFARKTVNLLADLDKSDAELFTNLCGFCWQIGDLVPLVFDENYKLYNSSGINFNTLAHLESLGLIQFESLTGYKRLGLLKAVTVAYYGRLTKLTFPNEKDNALPLGRVLLTRAGQQLAHVCASTPVEGFYEFVYDRWASESLVPKREIESSGSTPEPGQAPR